MQRIRIRNPHWGYTIFRYPYPYPSRIFKVILGSNNKTKDIITKTFYEQITRILRN